MTRTPRWPAVVGVLSLAALAVVGCDLGSNKNAAPTLATKAKSAGPREAKLFADWPTPAGALVITGEQFGYLTPCGCTEGQIGGLIRRQRLIEWMRSRGWPLALIDLGGLINDPTQHGGPVESKVRYTIALQALEDLKYDALAFSAHDLKLTAMEVLGQFANRQGPTKVVSANVSPDPAFGLESRFVPSLRTSAGPVALGITAVLDPEWLARVNDADAKELLKAKAPDDVLPGVLTDLEKDTHVQVLMVQGPPELAKRLAKSYPGFDIVVSTSVVVDPPKEPEMLNGGKTQLITVGQKGQYAGVVGLFQDPKQKFRYQRVWLNSRFDDDPALAPLGEPMRKLLDEQFPSALKGANVLETYPRRRYVAFDAPADAAYVGAETCRECHPKTYEHWSKTPHAKAYRGLTKPGRNREYDAECVSCHVTGFEYEGGYTTPEATAFLKHNQCENCHGPGSKHAAEPDNKHFLKAIARTADDARKNNRCLGCHNDDNDPHFKWETYWPKIEHTALDDYDDPKVHRGAASKAGAPGS